MARKHEEGDRREKRKSYVYVALHAEERELLERIAEKESRPLTQQVRHMVKEGFAARRLSAPA